MGDWELEGTGPSRPKGWEGISRHKQDTGRGDKGKARRGSRRSLRKWENC